MTNRGERPVLDDFDDEADAYLRPRQPNTRLPWILLFAAWGGAIACIGGLVGYLLLASDSIEEELKEQRPQITIQVKPKRRSPQSAETRPESRPSEVARSEHDPGATAAEPMTPEAGMQAAAAGWDAAAQQVETPAASSGQGQAAEGATPGSPAGENADLKAGPSKLLKASLNPHPDDMLIEQSDFGPLPKVDEAGRKPWRVYARPFDTADTRPRIAIVMTQLGLSAELTEEVISDLPGEVTLGFAPFARGLPAWIDQARGKGHEVLLGLPMEPQDYPRNDPGPYGLMIDNNTQENTERLNWVLSRVTGYVGIFNFMGSRFTVDKRAVKPVLDQLKQRGLLVLDTRASPFSVLASVAKELGVPYAMKGASPDEEPNLGYIDRQLAQLPALAVKHNKVIAILRPYPITVIRLKRWLSHLDTTKVALAPVSAVIATPGR